MKMALWMIFNKNTDKLEPLLKYPEKTINYLGQLRMLNNENALLMIKITIIPLDFKIREMIPILDLNPKITYPILFLWFLSFP